MKSSGIPTFDVFFPHVIWISKCIVEKTSLDLKPKVSMIFLKLILRMIILCRHAWLQLGKSVMFSDAVSYDHQIMTSCPPTTYLNTVWTLSVVCGCWGYLQNVSLSVTFCFLLIYIYIYFFILKRDREK